MQNAIQGGGGDTAILGRDATKYRILIIDGIGYLPMDIQGANLLTCSSGCGVDTTDMANIRLYERLGFTIVFVGENPKILRNTMYQDIMINLE